MPRREPGAPASSAGRRVAALTRHLHVAAAEGAVVAPASGAAPQPLSGRVAVVTGGAGGIGRAVALRFARAGAKVVVAGRTQRTLDRVAAEIRAAGGDAAAVRADVTDPADVGALVAAAAARFGRVDVMVNNAGGALKMAPPHELSPADWRAGIALNLDSVFLGSVAAHREMKKRRSGAIINISSVAGLDGMGVHFVHYAAAKAGAIMTSKVLANAYADDNVTVNCISPGLTATPGLVKMGWIPKGVKKDGTAVPPLRLPNPPEDVAELALFLASPAAGRLTGENYIVSADTRTRR